MTASVRKILALTTSRADWGHLVSPLKHLEIESQVRLSLVAMGSHLSPEFGMTVDQIETDGIDHGTQGMPSGITPKQFSSENPPGPGGRDIKLVYFVQHQCPDGLQGKSGCCPAKDQNRQPGS